MSKIGLKYVGDDVHEQRRLARTNGVKFFEAVDAREQLATPGSDYVPDEASKALIGRLWQPNPGSRANAEPAPWQLQGDDTELQTGLSAEKYGRSQVVKAIPSPMAPTTGVAQSTMGRPLTGPEEGGGAQGGLQHVDGRVVANGEGEGAVGVNTDGMTRDEIKAELRTRGVAFDNDMRKDDLAELLQKQAR